MERIFGKQYRSYWMGIAMIEVMLLHLVYQRGASDVVFKFAKMLFLQGDMGVNIFFLLSAFGLCFSYERYSFWGFYKRRIFRIFPIYFIYLCFISYYRLGTLDFQYLLLHLSGLNIFQQGELLGDAWYMSALILLYASFPMLYKLMTQPLMKKWYSVFLFVLLLTIVYYIPGVHQFFKGMFHARIQVIFLGIASFFLLKEKSEKDLLKLYAMVASLAIFTYNDCSFYFYIPLVLYAFDKSAVALPFFRTFSFIGKHSLEIYLAQVFTLQVLFANAHGNYYQDCCIYFLLTIPNACILWSFQNIFWKSIKLIKHE